jgi:hypothetical protein
MAAMFCRPQFVLFVSVGTLKILVYSAVTGCEVTLYQRLFDACQTIRSSPGNFETLRHFMAGRVRSNTDKDGGYFDNLL